MQIREAVTEFHFDYQVRKLSPKTIALYDRQLEYLAAYGLDISEITLRRWAKHLLDGEIIHRSEGRQDSEWRMTYTDSLGKHQVPVEEDDLPQMHLYRKQHGELLNEWRIACNGNESAAWSATQKQMWQEYQCCYYRCKCLTVNGIGNEEINTIVDLVDEILELNWNSSSLDQA